LTTKVGRGTKRLVSLRPHQIWFHECSFKAIKNPITNDDCVIDSTGASYDHSVLMQNPDGFYGEIQLTFSFVPGIERTFP